MYVSGPSTLNGPQIDGYNGLHDTPPWNGTTGDGTTRVFDASTASASDVANALANLVNDLLAMGVLYDGS